MICSSLVDGLHFSPIIDQDTYCVLNNSDLKNAPLDKIFFNNLTLFLSIIVSNIACFSRYKVSIPFSAIATYKRGCVRSGIPI